MSEQAQQAPKRPNGTPPGKGMVVPAHGGQIGNPAFVPTEAQRAQARQLAKRFPPEGERHIAVLMGMSRTTLRLHFADDIELGRAEMLSAVGAQIVARALDANAKDADGNLIVKGDLEAQKFVAARFGAWPAKVTHARPEDDLPQKWDLSGIPAERRAILKETLRELLTARGVAIDGGVLEAKHNDGTTRET